MFFKVRLKFNIFTYKVMAKLHYMCLVSVLFSLAVIPYELDRKIFIKLFLIFAKVMIIIINAYA